MGPQIVVQVSPDVEALLFADVHHLSFEAFGFPLPSGGDEDRFALYAVPWDEPDPGRVRLFAVDDAGTRVEQPFVDLLKPMPPRTDTITVSDAFLEFSDAGGRLSERIPRADFRGSVEMGESIHTILRGCSVEWETHDSVMEELRGEVTIDDRGVFVEDFSGRLNGNPVHVRGSRLWDKTLDLEAHGQGVSTGEVSALIDQNLGFHARGELDGTFKLVGDTLAYEGVFTGELEGYDMSGIRGRALVTPTEVLLSELGGVINGATFTGAGRFDITDPENVSFVLEGVLSQQLLPRKGKPGRVLAAWVVGGVIAICGAIGYGALARRLTESGVSSARCITSPPHTSQIHGSGSLPVAV